MAMVIDSSNGITFADSTTFNTAQSLGRRNRIINGNMLVDQRNAGASVTPTVSQTYTLDRWGAYLSQSSKYSVQQVSDGPAGFTKSLKVTSLSAYTVLAADFFSIEEVIEGYNVADLGWGASGAATVTLSFWVKSSLTGTFGGALYNYATNSYANTFSYTISAANTWEQKTVTVTGPTASTWNTTNGGAINVCFSVGMGSNYQTAAGSWGSTTGRSVSGAVNVVSTNGATFYVTGVQLEVGTKATPYEMQIYSDQLAQCMRYYQRIYPITGTTGSSTTNFYCNIQYTVPMRAIAGISLSGVFNVTDPAVASYTQSSAVVSVVGGQNTYGAYLSIQNFTGINTFRTIMANDFSQYVIASAEL